MKKACVAAILKAIQPVIKQELGRQGLYPTSYTLKSAKTGRITIEIMTDEFLPAVLAAERGE